MKSHGKLLCFALPLLFCGTLFSAEPKFCIRGNAALPDGVEAVNVQKVDDEIRDTVFSFAGGNSFLKMKGERIDGANGFSLACWVKPAQRPSKGTEFVLISKLGYHINLGYDAWGHFHFGNYDTKAKYVKTIAEGDYPPQKWYLITGVFDPAVSRSSLYINGDLVSSKPMEGGMLVNTGDYYFGCMKPDAAAPCSYKGEMDMLSIYDRALSPEEVKALYRNSK